MKCDNMKKILAIIVSGLVVLSLFGTLVNQIGVQGVGVEKSEKSLEKRDTTRITKTYEFDEPELIEQEDKIKKINIEGLEDTSGLGEPVLPAKTEKILLPEGTTVKDIEWEFEDKSLVSIEAEMKRTTGGKIGGERIELPEKKEVYPDNKVSYNLGRFRGYDILDLSLKPVEYHSEKKTAYHFKSASIDIELEENIGREEKFLGTRDVKEDIDMVRRMVDDTSYLDTYSDMKSGVYAGGTDYLLITPSSFLEEYERLLEHKEKRGVKTKAVTIEDIKSNCTGQDLQEKIRNCIIDHYQDEGIRYVCLGADTTDRMGNDLLPHRGLYAKVTGEGGVEDEVASDYYYGGLDGSWDADGNGVYGEWSDDPDWDMDVWVGRLTAETEKDVEAMVDKIISWELGENTKQHYSICQRDTTIGDMSNNKVENTEYSDAVHQILPSDWSINYDFQSETGGNTVEMFEAGLKGNSSGGTPPMFVNHGGHGRVNYFDVGGEEYSREEAVELSNEHKPILLSIACMSGAFDGYDVYKESNNADRDCLAETLLEEKDGGITAGYMNTRFGLGTSDGATGWTGAIDTNFYHAVFDQGFDNLGKAAQWARMDYMKEQIAQNSQPENERWATQNMNLLGDPEMPILEEVDMTTSDGRVELDQKKYRSEDVLNVSLYDEDLAGNDTFDVSLKSGIETSGETVELVESTSGKFTGQISVSKTDLSGVLQVQEGDTVTAEYKDTDTGDGTSELKTDTASIDDTKPEITGVAADEKLGVKIDWRTGERATSKVEYGMTTNLGRSSKSEDLTTDHSLKLSNMIKPNKKYYYRIVSSDEAGNTRVDDNGSSLYSFETGLDDVESGKIGWNTGLDSFWHVEDKRSYSGDSSWAYNDGENYDTGRLPNSGNLTSSWIDIGGTEDANLSYHDWVQTEDSTYGDKDIYSVHIRTDEQDWMKIFEDYTVEDSWDEHIFTLADHLDLKSASRLKVRFRFDTVDYVGNTFEGWYVDDIDLELPDTNEAPFIEILEPKTASVIEPGSRREIRWNLDDDNDPNTEIESDLYFSSDGGSSWELIQGNVSGKTNPNDITWEAPDIYSSKCKLKIAAEDSDGALKVHATSGKFAIGKKNIVDLSDSPSSKGWNFVSFNLETLTTDVSEILEDKTWGAGGNVEKATWYDSREDSWKTYVPGREDHYNDLQIWNRSKGMWIKVSGRAELTIIGRERNSTDIELESGWNMVGYPCSRSKKANETLPDQVTEAGIFNGSREHDIEYHSDLSAVYLEPGEGYWVYNDADHEVTWSLEC